MTDSLKEAFRLAFELPDERQDALAAILLEEMASEEKWRKSFEDSQDVLIRMAEEAVAEDERGETRDLDERR